MTEIIKIGVFGITGTMLAVFVKQSKPEYFHYIGVGLALYLFTIGFRYFHVMVQKIQEIKQLLGENGIYINTLLKVVGITYVSELSSALCKDAGLVTVATQIEMIGKISVLLAGIPIFLSVISQISQFA